MKTNKFLLLFFMIFVLTSLVYAIPDTLTIQGKLENNAGSPLTGIYDFDFKIYDNLTGGSNLFKQSLNITTDSSGLYSAVLSNLSLSFDSSYYLELTIDDEKQSPRLNITSSAYSYRSNISDNLDPIKNYSVANLTISDKILFGFGEFIDNLVNGYLRINGGLNVTGETNLIDDVHVNKNITIGDFIILNGTSINDWSNISNYIIEDNTSWNKTYADTLYADISVVGTVTSIDTDNNYLTGGIITDNGTISFNDSKLNSTIESISDIYNSSMKYYVDETKVSKSGDTITGDLNVTGILNVSDYVYFQNYTKFYSSNVFMTDIEGSVHHMGVDLENLDELYANVFLTPLTLETYNNISGNYINISAQGDETSITVNVANSTSANNYRLSYTNIQLELINGTDENPVLNRILIRLVDGVPTWEVTITEPTYRHAMAARVLVGDNVSRPYAASLQEDGQNGFLKRVQRTNRKRGLLYEEGLDFNVTVNDFVIGDGSFINGIYDSSITGNITLSEDGFFLVHVDGSYHWYTSLNEITSYSDGALFGSNKYVNIVWVVIPYDGTANIYAVVQTEPTVEYTSIVNAYSDSANTLSIYPNDNFLKLLSLPVFRTIINTNSKEFQTLPNGGYADDYRGGIAGGVSSGGGLSESDPVWTSDKSDYSTTTESNNLYAPINYGDDWNKTYADTLYADISVVDTNTNCSVSGSCSDIVYSDEYNIADGTTTGQMAFWDATTGKWTYTETSEFFWDDTNKRLGLGTATPNARFSLYNELGTPKSALSVNFPRTGTAITTGYATVEFVNTDQTTNNWANFVFNDAVSGAGAALVGCQFVNHSMNYGNLGFWTRGSTGNGIRLFVESNGNVGIGTATPNNKLQVAGLINFDDTLYNVGLGTDVLRNPTGGYSVGIGRDALREMTSGGFNMAVGRGALQKLTTGTYNVGIGYQAGYDLRTGTRNMFIGSLAGRNNIGSNRNVGIGTSALGGASSSSFDYNVGIGDTAGGDLTTGSSNVLIGGIAGGDLTTGDSNSLIGFSSGRLLTTGASNIFLGNYAGYRQTTASNLLIIDSQQRADQATEASNAILYGVMANSPEDQVLTINAKVGIGTNNPDNDSKLHVIGNTIINGDLALGTNTLDGLSSGDINASTIYYDTLVAKSPIFQCSNNWCMISFPELQKTLYIDKTIDWQINEIIYNDNAYTKTEFWNLVQGTQYENLALKLNEKLNKLQNKYNCESNGFTWESNKCYNSSLLSVEKDFAVNESVMNDNFTIEIVLKSYDEVVDKIPIYNTSVSNYTCTQLANDLTTYETICQNSKETNEVIDYEYEFKESCSWSENKGYYCNEQINNTVEVVIKYNEGCGFNGTDYYCIDRVEVVI